MSVIDAVKAANVARVRELLQAGGDANEPGPNGTTPLIEAARAGHVELVKLLLGANAEPSLQDDERESAILKAAAYGHRDVVSLLMPHASDDERDTARAFLKANADPNALPAREEPTEEPKGRWLAEVGARTSAFFGDDDAAKRLDRLERAEKKKR
jgi:ankyrin repeat protein